MKTIGVIAGTPVDTGMGMDFLRAQGIPYVGRHVSPNCEEQTRLQILYKDKLLEMTLSLIESMAEEGAQGILMYCNSLASAIDMEQVHSCSPIPVVTPLDIYAETARQYRQIGVISANGVSFSAIELTMTAASPDSIVFGGGLMPLVQAIETGAPPGEIVARLELEGLIRCLCAMGAQALVLGCTHFPYVKSEIEGICPVPVIDPAMGMLARLL